MNRNQSYVQFVKPLSSFRLAVVVAAALALTFNPSFAKDAPADSTLSADLQLARSLNRAFIELADQVEPSVVVISVETKNDPEALFGHQGLDRLPEFFRDRKSVV